MNWLKIVIGFSGTLVFMLFLGIFAWIYCWWKKQKLLQTAMISTYTLPNALIEQRKKKNEEIFKMELAVVEARQHMHSNGDIVVEDLDEEPAATERLKPTEGALVTKEDEA